MHVCLYHQGVHTSRRGREDIFKGVKPSSFPTQQVPSVLDRLYVSDT